MKKRIAAQVSCRGGVLSMSLELDGDGVSVLSRHHHALCYVSTPRSVKEDMEGWTRILASNLARGNISDSRWFVCHELDGHGQQVAFMSTEENHTKEG